MASRSEELARRVEEANNQLLAAAEASTDAQWTAPAADGDWTQGFVAYHAGTSIEGISGMVRGMANGEALPPVDFAAIDQMNAEFHSQFANATKAEAVEAIKRNSPAAVEMVRGLADEQLDHKAHLAATGGEVNVEQVIEMLLIGHPRNHAESITKAR